MTVNGQAIPLDEEPVILFRARDRLALPVLLAYREMCVADGCTGYQMQLIDERIAEFQRFTVEYADRMKQPGITRGL